MANVTPPAKPQARNPRSEPHQQPLPQFNAGAPASDGAEASVLAPIIVSEPQSVVPERSVVLLVDQARGVPGTLVRVPTAEANMLIAVSAARAATRADFGL